MSKVLFVVPHLSNSMRLLADYLRYLDRSFEVTLFSLGTDLTLTLLAGDVEIVSYPVEVADGDAWIFLAYTDGESIDVSADPVTDAVCRIGYDGPAAPPAP
jgi:hypothetical protein